MLSRDFQILDTTLSSLHSNYALNLFNETRQTRFGLSLKKDKNSGACGGAAGQTSPHGCQGGEGRRRQPGAAVVERDGDMRRPGAEGKLKTTFIFCRAVLQPAPEGLGAARGHSSEGGRVGIRTSLQRSGVPSPGLQVRQVAGRGRTWGGQQRVCWPSVNTWTATRRRSDLMINAEIAGALP